ncbi:hypothetical protein KAW80_02655 [Candidatus Babeliales bacterium]|nr:hypothetical protein [Candidatus Babeliales bacterium]
MKTYWNNGFKKIIGILLIIIGIPGLFLPFLQGIVFIIIGTTLLGNKKLISYLKKIKHHFSK